MDVDGFQFLLDAVMPLTRMEDTSLRQSVSSSTSCKPLQKITHLLDERLVTPQHRLAYRTADSPECLPIFSFAFFFFVAILTQLPLRSTNTEIFRSIKFFRAMHPLSKKVCPRL